MCSFRVLSSVRATSDEESAARAAAANANSGAPTMFEPLLTVSYSEQILAMKKAYFEIDCLHQLIMCLIFLFGSFRLLWP